MNLDELIAAMKARLTELENAPQMKEPTADVWANAPLALMQMSISGGIEELRRALELVETVKAQQLAAGVGDN